LFGFAGQGMDFLKHLDSLVMNDNQLQESDRASKVAGLKDYAAGQLTGRDFAKERGATDYAAKLTEANMKYTAAQEQIKMMAEGDPMKQAPALQMIQGIEQKKFENQRLIANDAQNRADEMEKRRIEWAKINLMKARAGAAAPKGAAARRLMDLRSSIDALENMKKLAGDTNIAQRGIRAVGEAVTSGESAKNNEYERERALAFAGLSRYKHEYDQLIKLIPSRSGLKDAGPSLDLAIQTAKKKYADTLAISQGGTDLPEEEVVTPEE
jgi:hypothetical protein